MARSGGSVWGIEPDGTLRGLSAGWFAGGAHGLVFLIIGSAASRVAKDGEGLHDALQFGGRGFAAVQVRVVRAHQGTVSTGDLLLRRRRETCNTA